ncbi:PDZ domain-containing protein, partial [Streptococcus suis]
YKGVYVLNLAKNSTFKDRLHLADTVTGVNGKSFKNSSQLIKYVAALHLGDKVKVQYTSQGKKKESVGKVIKLSNGKNGIGI